MQKDKKTLHDHFMIFQKLLFIGVGVMLSAILFQYTDFFWILWALGLLIMIAGIIYSTIYFRCPHCDTRLDPRGKVPNFCPNCGKELQ